MIEPTTSGRHDHASVRVGRCHQGGQQASPRTVGVTDTAGNARARMLEALAAAPAGLLAKGWIIAVALGADRLTYDRLNTVAQVTRGKDGTMRWQLTDHEPEQENASGPDAQVTVIDGRQLRQLRRARGLSQENLAWTAGLGLTTIARLESQPRPRCRYGTLARLAAVLGENPRAIADGPRPRSET
jgi:DNA-binding XRE family transcriptional regulator